MEELKEDHLIKQAVLKYFATHSNHRAICTVSDLRKSIQELDGVEHTFVEVCVQEMLEDDSLKHPDNSPDNLYMIAGKGRRFYDKGGYTKQESDRIIQQTKAKKAEGRQKVQDIIKSINLPLQTIVLALSIAISIFVLIGHFKQKSTIDQLEQKLDQHITNSPQ